MSDNDKETEGAADALIIPQFNVAPSPHVSDTSITTKRVMIDVLIGLVPLVAWGCYAFGPLALKQVGLCVVSCLVFELIFTKMRGQTITLTDFSAAITGVILGLSLPATAPWWISVIGSGAGIGLGKVVFGGLGFNMFNPAMVGRAFIMISFAGVMGSSAYQLAEGTDVMTQATPLADAKVFMSQVFEGQKPFANMTQLLPRDLFLGNHNGSVGEISALCAILGGLYLIVRRAAAWQIPAGAIVGLVVCSGITQVLQLTPLTVVQHLCTGAFMFGAFFIITDPVTNPMSRMGRFYFGLGYGILVVLLRVFSGYPEGVMFAVLIMNAAVPLINRFTVPTPVGGPVAQQA